MTSRISQREARRLKKRVQQLEDIEKRRRENWSREWFGGTEIGALELGDNHVTLSAVRTARKLAHYVVAVNDGSVLRFYAVRQGQ